MINGLEALEEISLLVDVRKEHINEYLNIIEKELKDYQEIKEIAKHYNWDDITNEIFSIKTDKKYRDLFDSAIINIQEDYRKARALEVIKTKRVNIARLMICLSLKEYNKYIFDEYRHDVERIQERVLTQEEYDSLEEVLL